jgi:hypothetical protein
MLLLSFFCKNSDLTPQWGIHQIRVRRFDACLITFIRLFIEIFHFDLVAVRKSFFSLCKMNENEREQNQFFIRMIPKRLYIFSLLLKFFYGKKICDRWIFQLEYRFNLIVKLKLIKRRKTIEDFIFSPLKLHLLWTNLMNKNIFVL